MKKVYVFLADGFEETEAIFPIDLLIRVGATVEKVSVTGKNLALQSGRSICFVTMEMVLFKDLKAQCKTNSSRGLRLAGKEALSLIHLCIHSFSIHWLPINTVKAVYVLGASLVAQTVKKPPARQETQV